MSFLQIVQCYEVAVYRCLCIWLPVHVASALHQLHGNDRHYCSIAHLAVRISACHASARLVRCLPKNDINVGHYNIDIRQPIVIIFGRNAAKRVRFEMVVLFPTSTD